MKKNGTNLKYKNLTNFAGNIELFIERNSCLQQYGVAHISEF